MCSVGVECSSCVVWVLSVARVQGGASACFRNGQASGSEAQQTLQPTAFTWPDRPRGQLLHFSCYTSAATLQLLHFSCYTSAATLQLLHFSCYTSVLTLNISNFSSPVSLLPDSLFTCVAVAHCFALTIVAPQAHPLGLHAQPGQLKPAQKASWKAWRGEQPTPMTGWGGE